MLGHGVAGKRGYIGAFGSAFRGAQRRESRARATSAVSITSHRR